MADPPVLPSENDARSELTIAVELLDGLQDWARVQPEDVIHLQTLYRSLEPLLLQSEPPSTDGSSVVARAAVAIWTKLHGSDAPIEQLLNLLTDDAPVVRATAADALRSVLTRAGALQDESLAIQVNQVVETQREVENSPLIAQQLRELAAITEASQPVRRRVTRTVRRNPYVAGLPVRDRSAFYGREDTIAGIRQALGRSGTNSIILHGARRTGKTSLLHQIRNGVLGNEYLAVYFDLQSVAGTSVDNVVRAIKREVAAAIRAAPDIAATSLSEDEWAGSLADLRSALVEWTEAVAPRTLLLLLDEYEVLAEFLVDQGVGRQFQSLHESVHEVRWIFAGAQKVEQIEARSFMFLLDASAYIKLTYLSPADTERLITEPASGQLTYTPGAITRIEQQTAGHPFYTQLICQTVFDLDPPNGRVRDTHVDEACALFVRNPSPHAILTWNALRIDQRLIGSALAAVSGSTNQWAALEDIAAYLRQERFPVRVGLPAAKEALASLRDLDWVDQRQDSFRFTLGLLQSWVRQTRTIWELVQEYRDGVEARRASPARQELAWLIDLPLLIVLTVISGSIFIITVSESNGLYLGVAVTLLLYSLTGVFNRGTPGQRIMNLELLSPEGLALPPKERLRLSSALLLRAALWGGMFVGLWFFEPSSEPWSLWLGLGPLLLTEGAELLLLLTGPKRQGLFARIGNYIAARDVSS